MIHWWKHNQLCYVVTFSYNPNEMDNCLTLVLLARSLFVGHPPLAIYWDWMLASLIMSITLIVDGGCPSSWTPLKIAKFAWNLWSIGNHLLCWHVYTFLCIFFYLWIIIGNILDICLWQDPQLYHMLGGDELSTLA